MLATLFWLSIFLIVYTYIGYPLVLALIVKFKTEQQPFPISDGSVTLLVTAYNEEAAIAKKIENCLSLDYPRDKLQIIVAADGSSDRTVEIVGQFKEQGIELNYIPQRNGKMAAINRAIPQARGEVIVFSDANNMYEPGAIRKLVDPFYDASIGMTTGSKLIIQDGSDLSEAEGVYWKYESWIKKNETALGTCTSSVGEILAIRRDLYIAPPNDIINDDYYMVLDLIKRGFRVYYVPEARSFEYASATTHDEMVRRSRMNTGKYQAIFRSYKLLPFNRPLILWQIISHKYCRAFLPFGFIGALVTNLLIVLMPRDVPSPVHNLPSIYAWIFLSQLLFYAVAGVGSLYKFPGLFGKLFYLPSYLVGSNLAILRGFYGFITRKQTNIWERVRRSNV
jgi:cellulose synthase/poly-beta-1,6-N-acetylglucosamine synthase-like glycosyltransferase